MTKVDPSGCVLYERVGSVGVISLNNASKRNCITVEMRPELAEAFDQAEGDGCTAVILTGVGGTFSSGGDLSSASDSDRASRQRMHSINDVVRAIVRFPAPVIAAIDGVAFGAGLSLTAVCDLVVANVSARFAAPFARVGLVADTGIHYSLPMRIGLSRARWMILTGAEISGETAATWGLVDELTDGPALPVALDLTQRLSARAPLSLAASKMLLTRPGLTLGDALEAEQAAQVRLMASEDYQEGRKAFLEKRPPRFIGR